MVSVWVLLCSSLLGCFILQSQIRGASSVPYVFNTNRDTEGIIDKSLPSKKYHFTNPISWSSQFKREGRKRGFSFHVPSSWSSNFKRGDFTFSLPGYWSHSRGAAPRDGLNKRGSLISAEHPLQDLGLCDDMAGLKSSLSMARNAIAKLQEDCAMIDVSSLKPCLTEEENDLLNELYATAKKGAEQLGWCLVESDISL